MKKSYLLYTILFLVAVVALQGCRKDSFDGEDLGDKGTTFIKTPKGSQVVQWLSEFTDKRRLTLFNILKDAHNNAELNKISTIKLLQDPGIIEDYNEENETNFVELPSSFFEWVSPSNVSFAGKEATIQFDSKNQFGEFDILLDGSKWTDIGIRYALAFRITDYGGVSPSAVSADTIIVQLGIKNIYDGIYSVEDGNVQRYSSPTEPTSGDALNGSLAGNPDVTLATIDENTVEVSGLTWAGGTSGIAGIDHLQIRVDPITNKLTIFSLGNPTATVIPGAENSYDPETKTFTINFHWNTTANKREITNLILKFKEGR